MGLVVAIICKKDYCIMLAQVRIICRFVKFSKNYKFFFAFGDVRHVAGEQEIKPFPAPLTQACSLKFSESRGYS